MIAVTKLENVGYVGYRIPPLLTYMTHQTRRTADSQSLGRCPHTHIEAEARLPNKPIQSSNATNKPQRLKLQEPAHRRSSYMHTPLIAGPRSTNRQTRLRSTLAATSVRHTPLDGHGATLDSRLRAAE